MTKDKKPSPDVSGSIQGAMSAETITIILEAMRAAGIEMTVPTYCEGKLADQRASVSGPEISSSCTGKLSDQEASVRRDTTAMTQMQRFLTDEQKRTGKKKVTLRITDGLKS